MDGKRGIWCAILTVLMTSCGLTSYDDGSADITLSICDDGRFTRAYDPDEGIINDMTLMIFDEDGNLEESAYFQESLTGEDYSHRIRLLKHKRYSFYVCVNFGRKVMIDSMKELEELRWHMAYPDDYREGMAMAGKVEDLLIEGDAQIVIPVKRLMSKISLKIDRSGLSDDVSMFVTAVKIGNCPKSASVFTPSAVSSKDECFASGFTRSVSECSILNIDTGGKVSGSLSLYMLENMQGKGPDPATASYIEVRADYLSDRYHTSGKPLVYRFHIGEEPGNADVERNCHYRITVIPEDDGLSGDGWAVDKSGLEDTSVYFGMTPSGFITKETGDSLHVRCRVYPSGTRFDIGMEELEYDSSRGIYDYEIDEDGYGVRLVFRKKGTAILYMSAGEPVNESGMLVIEVQ